MVYMGSKEKLAKYIVPILQKTIDENNCDTYIECFVGGANIINKIKCKNRFGYDRSDTLIALLKQAQDDFSKIKEDGNLEDWNKGKNYVKNGIMPNDMTLADIGAIEFFRSYGAGGFPRGFVKDYQNRNPYKERRANLEKQSKSLKDIKFNCQNYWELKPCSNAVIYLDPPYQGTKIYGYASQEKIDYDFFWNWVRKISKNNYVFISEQKAPEDFEVLWKKEISRQVAIKNDFKATEKLFKLKEN